MNTADKTHDPDSCGDHLLFEGLPCPPLCHATLRSPLKRRDCSQPPSQGNAPVTGDLQALRLFFRRVLTTAGEGDLLEDLLVPLELGFRRAVSGVCVLGVLSLFLLDCPQGRCRLPGCWLSRRRLRGLRPVRCRRRGLGTSWRRGPNTAPAWYAQASQRSHLSGRAHQQVLGQGTGASLTPGKSELARQCLKRSAA